MATKIKPKPKQKKKKERSTLDSELNPALFPPECLDTIQQDNLIAPLVKTIEENVNNSETEQEVMPSAPIFDELCSNIEQINIKDGITERIHNIQNVVLPMQLEETEKLFCGNQIALVKIINAKEYEASKDSLYVSPDHPLVDLLSTFKQSLIAVERERKLMTSNFIKENKYRSSLWKVEKREAVVKEKCSCGLNVQVRVQYDYATLWRDKLPVAKMKLEALSRDVEESYCHQLHCALQAHIQIEEFICGVLATTNSKVRKALSLVMEALRTSDSTLEVHSDALQRWATVLVAGLLRYGHLEDLLFVCHHLYRQNRSVYWAGRLISMSAGDLVETARVIGLLEVILTAKGPAKASTEDQEWRKEMDSYAPGSAGSGRESQLDEQNERWVKWARTQAAAEQAEKSSEQDNDQVWEEVDKRGSGCAVSHDSLRERDLLMILLSMPMTEVIARLALVRHRNINDINEFEWGDESKGHGVLKSICGSRVFLNALHQGTLAHPHYNKLAKIISMLAVECLRALADLHAHTKDKYDPELITKISTEFEAAFCQAWAVLLTTGAPLDQLPFDILSYQTARNYLVTLTHYLHEKPSDSVTRDTIQIETDKLDCHKKLRILGQMAVTRVDDYDLAKSIINFLIHESFSTKVSKCSARCEQTARELLSAVLRTHPYLYADTICTFATFRLGDEIERGDIKYLSLVNWVPGPQEVTDVMWKVTQKLPVLLPDILMSLDFSPQTGLALETQLSIASFLCKWTEDKITNSEWRWVVLRRLKIHRSEWGPVGDVPSPEANPEDLFTKMATLLATSWGHCVPMICEYGVEVLCALSRAGRVREAIHCLQHVTRVMADAPESITFTPMFGELCNILSESGPSLVQRALGRGGVSGQSLLLDLLIQQLYTRRRPNENTLSLLAAWVQLCRSHPLLVEVALVCCYDCTDLDHYMATLFQQDDQLLKQLSSHTSSSTPTLSLHTLMTLHTLREVSPGSWSRLLLELHAQKCKGAKIHVDNAVQSIKADFPSEDLVIYRTASAVLATPVQHPSHLFLWRWFFYLYLQRSPNNMHEHAPPIGPLFFDGLLKSRTLQQLKRKLQDAITYHRTEYGKQHSPIDSALKHEGTSQQQNSRARTPEVDSKIKNIMANKCDIFPPLKLMDLTGEVFSTLDSGSDAEETLSDGEVSESPRVVVDHALIKSYHHDAAKTCDVYLRWLMDGDKTRALPHHAELSHYISAQALNAAWKLHLKSISPPSEPNSNHEPRRTVPEPPKPPAERFKIRLQKIKTKRNRDNRSIVLRPAVQEVPNNARSLAKSIQDQLDTINKFAHTRANEIAKLSKLDESLWRSVSSLYTTRALDPVRRTCANNCPPLTLIIPGQEWCLCPRVDREIEHNRVDALQSLVRLARPKPRLANATAALLTLSRMVETKELAVNICDLAFDRVKQLDTYPPARDACVSLVTELAQKFISKDGVVCAQLIQKWSVDSKAELSQTLCTALLDPVSLSPAHYSLVYRAILHSQLSPHVVFSLLSRFEIQKWLVYLQGSISDELSILKKELLYDIVAQLQTYGIEPKEHYIMLVELLCIHMTALVDPREFRQIILTFAQAASKTTLPHIVLIHMVKCAQIYGDKIPPEAMTTIFYELAKIWHEARDTAGAKLKHHPQMYVPYVVPYASTLGALTLALIRSLEQNTHNTPQHITRIVWSCSVECYSPWILCTNLLPPHQLEDMRYYFQENLCHIHNMVPEGQNVLFQEVFKWVGRLPPSELDLLLPYMSALPWTAQWFHGTCLPTALKLSQTPKTRTFLYEVTRSMAGETWLLGVSETDISPYLATLLSFLSIAHLDEEALKKCKVLPWHRLPLMALEPELERFFAHHFNSTVVYYKLPQFVVILSASEMLGNETCATETALPKRLALLSYWLRALTSPRPESVWSAEVRAMLSAVTELYGISDEKCTRSQKEIVDMLSLAMTIFCTEPAAAAVLSVWLEWLRSSPKVLVQASVSSVVNLTSHHYYTKLADPIIRAYFSFPGSSWLYVRECWSRCVFGPHSAATAYARASAVDHRLVAQWITAMTAMNINFVQEEMALALWISLIVRISLQRKGDTKITKNVTLKNKETVGHAPTMSVSDDVTEVGKVLLSSWAEEPRLSLLQAITRSRQEDKPTPKLRLLARLSLCILEPSEAAIEMYKSCHLSLFPSTVETASWGGNPNPICLPRLAVILFPNSENFFSLELDLMTKLWNSIQ